MTEDLNQNYNITKPHNIKLKGITLGLFLLFCVLCPVKNIAMHNPPVVMNNSHVVMNNSPVVMNNSPIVTDNSGIVLAALYGIITIVLDSIIPSLYNYFTGHNKIKHGWYRNKFFLYAGRKINITKELYIDLYFSIYRFLLEIYFSPNEKKFSLTWFMLSLVSFNIRVYKEFYISFTTLSVVSLFITILAGSILHFI